MIDVGMGEQHEIQIAHPFAQSVAILRIRLTSALKQAAIDQEPEPPGLDQKA
jgi:hypothetical protein